MSVVEPPKEYGVSVRELRPNVALTRARLLASRLSVMLDFSLDRFPFCCEDLRFLLLFGRQTIS